MLMFLEPPSLPPRVRLAHKPATWSFYKYAPSSLPLFRSSTGTYGVIILRTCLVVSPPFNKTA